MDVEEKTSSNDEEQVRAHGMMLNFSSSSLKLFKNERG